MSSRNTLKTYIFSPILIAFIEKILFFNKCHFLKLFSNILRKLKPLYQLGYSMNSDCFVNVALVSQIQPCLNNE